jgi:preprotein translocase subunit SecA
MEEDVPLESRLVSRSIEGAQSKVEGFNFDSRRHVVEYDDVMNTQRKIIYGERRRVLEGVDTRTNVLDFIRAMIADSVPGYCDARHRELWDIEGLWAHLGSIVPLPPLEQLESTDLGNSPEAVVDSIYDMVLQAYEALENQIGAETMRQVERYVMLHTIDQRWVAYLTNMEHLKEAIGLQGYAQKDPLIEYKNEAFREFEQLKRDIQFEIATNIFRIEIRQEPPPPVRASSPAQAVVPAGNGAASLLPPSPLEENGRVTTSGPVEPGGGVAAAVEAPAVPRYQGLQGRAGGSGSAATAATSGTAGKVGRNDPCPCGSGRKYKRCHGQ